MIYLFTLIELSPKYVASFVTRLQEPSFSGDFGTNASTFLPIAKQQQPASFELVLNPFHFLGFESLMND